MSIRDEIGDQIRERRLFLLEPALASSPSVRTMIVSAEIRKLFIGPWEDTRHEYRSGRLRADLDTFTEGRVISVAQAAYKKPKTTYMARLEPLADEVWKNQKSRSQAGYPRLRSLRGEGRVRRTNVGNERTYSWTWFERMARCPRSLQGRVAKTVSYLSCPSEG